MNTPDYLLIPHILIRDKNITPTDCLVYSAVYMYSSGRSGRCYASNKSLSEIVLKTPETVANCLVRLESFGYIKRVFSDESKRSRQEIIPMVLFGKVSLKNDTGIIEKLNKVSLNNEQSNISNKISNTVADATAPFSFEEELEILRSSSRKDYKIIALYWKNKEFTFDNKTQFNSALKRELRAAKSLKGYTGTQIGSAIKYCKNKFSDVGWTLETCHKRIDDVISKQK